MTNLLIANGRLGDFRNTSGFTFASHNGLSAVDYLLCSLEDSQHIKHFCILNFNEFSDHSPILFSLSSKNPRHQTPQNNPNQYTNYHGQPRLIYDEAKSSIFRNQLTTCDCVLNQLIDNVNIGHVDSIVQSFTNFVYNCAACAFGKTGKGKIDKVTKPKNLWFDDKCIQARNDFKWARNRFLKNKNDVNRQHFISLRSKYNKIKNIAKKNFKIKEGQELCSMAKSKPKQFWKTVKKSYVNSKTIKSDTLTASELFEHFKSIYGNEPEPSKEQPQDPSLHENQTNANLDGEISEHEIKKAVFAQKNNKSSGTDLLCAELFKSSFNILSPFLLKMYNRLFANGEYPRLWGEGIIVPIFKGGNPNEAGNYRGITLINIMGKIYSQILLNRLNEWADNEDKILDSQFGFQKGKSTIDCIFTFHSVIAKTLSAGEKLYCIFIDYEKAFDKVNRTFLWQKLLSENVSTKFVSALRSMYSIVRSCVRFQSAKSRFFTSYNG